jgi:hypothetical protein
MSTQRVLRLNSEDNVVIAVDEIKVGDAPVGAPRASERVQRGHKMATMCGLREAVSVRLSCSTRADPPHSTKAIARPSPPVAPRNL